MEILDLKGREKWKKGSERTKQTKMGKMKVIYNKNIISWKIMEEDQL